MIFQLDIVVHCRARIATSSCMRQGYVRGKESVAFFKEKRRNNSVRDAPRY